MFSRIDHLVGHDAAAARAPCGPRSVLNCAAGVARRGGGQGELLRIERLLDGPPAGGVVERRGEGQAGALRQRVDALHQSLAEARLAHDGGAVVVLQSAGDDLRSAGALAVDQHGQRERVRLGARRAPSPSRSATERPRTVTTFCPGFRNSDAVSSAAVSMPPGLLRRSSTSPFSLCAAELLDGLADLRPGLFVEARDPQVADARPQQEGPLHAGRLQFLRGQTSVSMRALPGRLTTSCACCWRDCAEQPDRTGPCPAG